MDNSPNGLGNYNLKGFNKLRKGHALILHTLILMGETKKRKAAFEAWPSERTQEAHPPGF
jgi:hypothetical protein